VRAAPDPHVAVAATIISLSVLVACDDLCGNDKLAEYPSPDRQWKVVVFQRDCGATTGFSTQAALLPLEEEWPNRSGNIFTSTTDHGAAPSGPGGGPELGVYWESSTVLVLRHHPKASVWAADHKANVTIRLQPEDGGGITTR
jgi:hypothetical protein